MNLSNLRNIIVEKDEMGPPPIIPTIRRWVIPAGYSGGAEGPPLYKYRPTIVDYDGPGGFPPGWHDPDGPGPLPPIRVNPNPPYDYDGDGVVGDKDDQLYHPGFNDEDVWGDTVLDGHWEVIPYTPIPTFPGPWHGRPPEKPF